MLAQPDALASARFGARLVPLNVAAPALDLSARRGAKTLDLPSFLSKKKLKPEQMSHSAIENFYCENLPGFYCRETTYPGKEGETRGPCLCGAPEKKSLKNKRRESN